VSDFSVHIEGAKEAAATLRRFQATRVLVSFADGVMPRMALGLRQWAPYRDRPEDFSESGPPPRHLRDSIRVVRHTTPESVQILATSDVPQARFTVHGTRPHVIEARGEPGRHFLRFVSSRTSEMVFAEKVHHPGTRPNPWPRHWAESELLPGLAGELARAVERELAR
jgi:hypothetical protein